MPRLRNLSINRVGMEIISTSWIACNERPSFISPDRFWGCVRMAEQHSNVIRECNNWTAENYPFPIRKLVYDKEKLSLRFQDLYQRMHNSEIKRSRRGKRKERKEGRKISKVKLILVTRRDGFHGRQRISTLWINFERIITRW